MEQIRNIKKKSSITITDEHLGLYGFSCFHFRGEELLKNGVWEREIELAKGAKDSPEKAIFRIPEEKLLCLSKAKKITTHPHFAIDNVSDPIPAIKLLLARAGWNQTTEDLQSMHSHAADGTFLARFKVESRDIGLGSGVSLPVGDDLAWIGMILVHPELRRQGIAKTIMSRCLTHARTIQRRSIVGLDATPLGKQVYDSLGFQDSFLIWRSVLPTSLGFEKYLSCKVNLLNNEDAANYLSTKNYEERSSIIALLSQLPGSYNLQATTSGKLCGIALSRPGRIRPFIGTLIADSPDIAKDLIAETTSHWQKAGYDSVFMDIPERHLDGKSIFSSETSKLVGRKGQIPVNPIRSFVRMYQLIAPDEQLDPDMSGISEALLQSSNKGFAPTVAFMNKEKNELVPIMYGTNGPEWS